MKQMYVQHIAQNYYKNVISDPKDIKVHNCFLYGADKEHFYNGYLALLSFFRNIYKDIADDPAAFGMLLKECDDTDAKNADYTNSNASLVRIPNLLLLIGSVGTLQSDTVLMLDGQDMLSVAKELKITNMTFLLNKLKDYGFEINGYDKAVKAGDSITITYLDNPYLTIVLKSLSDALMELNNGDIKKSKNLFYMMHTGLIENEKVKEPKMSIDALYHVLDEEKQSIAINLNDFITPSAKAIVKMGGIMRNDWSCTYAGLKTQLLPAEAGRLGLRLKAA